MSAMPNQSSDERGGGRGGGVLRFVIAVMLTFLLLGGVVVGMAFWMRATSRSAYKGPEKLTFPENRPFR